MLYNLSSHIPHFHYIGQQLGINDLPDVMEELNIICAKWYDVGMQLRVSVDTLDAIKEKNPNNPSSCLRETLKTWLKEFPQSPTWNNIIDALRSNVVGEVRLAAHLEQTHCPVKDTSLPAITPPVSPPQSLTLMTPSPTAHHTQPSCFGFTYTMAPQPHSCLSPTWSPYYYHPTSSYPVSTLFCHPHTSRANNSATLPNSYSQHSQVLPVPTRSISRSSPSPLVSEQLTMPQLTPSLLPIHVTASPQYTALQSLPISGNFVPEDTPTPPATVTTATHPSQGILYL